MLNMINDLMYSGKVTATHSSPYLLGVYSCNLCVSLMIEKLLVAEELCGMLVCMLIWEGLVAVGMILSPLLILSFFFFEVGFLGKVIR